MAQIRQLAAIMFTDIVGYTALMGHDENKAFELLRKNRDLQKSCIEEFSGQWIKELGDGVMASFNSVSNAIHAAIKIQEACNAAGEFQLRIGIHLGEVVFENKDVFGDGVNIASRIQACAAPGAIYISESVYANISNRSDFQTKFIKKESLKNVKESVKIYEVMLINGHSSEQENQKAYIRQNSIAVLPFANMSSDPEQEYFSDGLTEEIISDLSKVKALLVISRSSVMTLKGTQKKIKEIAAEVNVRYILEGSVRKAGQNIRITTQLIDATNDSTIWTEKYNGVLDDVFEIQENVSRSIVDALKLKLTPEEDHLIAERPITNIHAYECYLRARREVLRGSEEATASAINLLQSGLDLVGPNDLLYAMLGYTNFFYFRFVNKSDRTYLKKAQEYAIKAFELNADSALGYVVKGWVQWNAGDLEASGKSMKEALRIEPNNYDALFGLAEVYLYAGLSSTESGAVDIMMEIDPLTPMTQIMKGSYYVDTNIEDGLPYFEKAYMMDPQSPLTQWMLASAYFWSGKKKKALPLVEHLAASSPDWAFTKQLLFLTHGLQGDKEKALSFATKQLEEEARNDHHFAFHLSECYAMIDDKEKALNLLEFSMEIFFPYSFLLHNPLFANIRHEEKFKQLMTEAKRRSDAFEI